MKNICKQTVNERYVSASKIKTDFALRVTKNDVTYTGNFL